MLVSIGVLLLLLLINGFFAASEIALLSVNPNKIRLKAEDGDKKAILLRKTIEDPSKFLATIQIGITFAGLFSGAFASANFSDALVAFLLDKGVNIPKSVLQGATIAVITLGLSYFQLVIGELVPKRIAMRKADAMAPIIVTPIHFLAILTTPFVKLLSFTTNVILRLVGIDPNDKNEEVTEEEIRMLVDVGGDTGSIDEVEKEMINNIFEFDNKTVDDIALHRTDIVALSIDSQREEILSMALNERFSRIPIYEDNIDNIVGILHLKDLLKYVFNEKSAAEKIPLHDLMRKPYFVPVSKKTDKLFEDMKKNKIHMAIVVDEYGGTQGLVTMEDLIEEIMGNIYDEYDEVEVPEIEQIAERTYRIQGCTEIDTIEEFFGIDFPEDDDYETLSGFLIGQVGRIPEEDEPIPEIEWASIIFSIEKIIDKKIESVVAVRQLPDEESEHSDKNDKHDKNDKSDKSDKLDKSDKTDKNDKNDKKDTKDNGKN